MSELIRLNKKIIRCKKCPRLVSHIRTIAQHKVRRFNDQKYWGRPLTGFGDIDARLLIIGLAPAAHGGNRTGRMFTGDSSGDWLAKILYNFGFANKSTSKRVDDGLKLIDTFVTASVRCAPPQNKPLEEEMHNCSTYLREELDILKNVKVIICLGRIAFDSCCKLLGISGYKFSHGNSFTFNNYRVICSYHPSRQNTQTGRLTWNQWYDIFSQSKRMLDEIK